MSSRTLNPTAVQFAMCWHEQQKHSIHMSNAEYTRIFAFVELPSTLRFHQNVNTRHNVPTRWKHKVRRATETAIALNNQQTINRIDLQCFPCVLWIKRKHNILYSLRSCDSRQTFQKVTFIIYGQWARDVIHKQTNLWEAGVCFCERLAKNITRQITGAHSSATVAALPRGEMLKKMLSARI